MLSAQVREPLFAIAGRLEQIVQCRDHVIIVHFAFLF